MSAPQTRTVGSDPDDWGDTEAPHTAELFANLIAAHQLRPELVVHRACGGGLMLRGLSDLAALRGLGDARFRGWDSRSAAIERASRHANERVTFERGEWLDQAGRTHLLISTIGLGDDLAAWRAKTDHLLVRIPLRMGRVRRASEPDGVDRCSRDEALARLRAAGFRPLGGVYFRRSQRSGGIGRMLRDAVRARMFRAAPHATVRLLGGYDLVVLCA